MKRKLWVAVLAVTAFVLSGCMEVPTEQPDVTLDSYTSAVLSETIRGDDVIDEGDEFVGVRVIYSESIEELYNNDENLTSEPTAGFEVMSTTAYKFGEGSMSTEQDKSQAHTITADEATDYELIDEGLKVETSVTGLKQNTEYYARLEAYGEDTHGQAQYVYSPIVNFRTANYTINFNANGGSGNMDTVYFASDRLQALPKNAFKRSGYLFREWNTKADGSGESYADGA